MKKILIISILLTFMLCGCDKNEDSVQNQASNDVEKDIYYEELDMREEKEYLNVFPHQISEFSEGIAWIEAINEENGEKMHVLINEEGNAVYVETGEIVYLSECQDGLVYLRKIDDGKVVSKVIDKEGEILFESKDIEDCTILAYGSDMFIVGKYVSGFDVNEKQIGVVNRKGEWVQPLNTDKFIVEGECVIDEITTGKQNSIRYLGDGVFVATRGALEFVFYNVIDNISFQFSGAWSIMGDYYNGKTLLEYNNNAAGYSRGIYSLDKNGNIVKISDSIEKYIDVYRTGEYADGLWYYEGCFYDADGQKIVDISQYSRQIENVNYYYPVFKNGYSVIVLQGADGGTYYTVINMQGQFMFEPRMLELAYYQEESGLIDKWDKTSPGELSEQIFSIYENGKWVYYNVNGEKVLEVNKDVSNNGTSISTFDLETALLKCREGLFYVGKDGELKLEYIKIDKCLLEK